MVAIQQQTIAHVVYKCCVAMQDYLYSFCLEHLRQDFDFARFTYFLQNARSGQYKKICRISNTVHFGLLTGICRRNLKCNSGRMQTMQFGHSGNRMQRRIFCREILEKCWNCISAVHRSLWWRKKYSVIEIVSTSFFVFKIQILSFNYILFA